MGFFAVVASPVGSFNHEFRPMGGTMGRLCAGVFRWAMVDAAPAVIEAFGNI
jgi:hypothetical protein